MVKATFVLSTLFALTVAVSAAPFLEELLEDGLVNIEAEDHIGTGDVEVSNVAENAVQVNDPRINDNGNNLDVL